MSDSVWPHRRQPTRLPRPWDFPGKSTGVGCHCLLELQYYNHWSYIKLCIWSTASSLVIISVESSVIYLVIQEIIILWNKQNTNGIVNNIRGIQFTSVQLLSRVRLFQTRWTEARQASLSITNSWSPPKPMSIESVMPSNHLILCCLLLLLPSIFPSIRVFSSESDLRIRWPKYWSFSFNMSPSNEHPGLISFRIDWLDLRTGESQGTLKSLLQYYSSKASILQLSAFFMVQLSHA